MAVGHQEGVYLYWTTVMWLGYWKNLISWDGKCCLNLVWFEFSHRTMKLSQTVHMQSSHYGLCWLNQIIVPHSSPQILQPEVWSWSSSDPPILRKQPTAMCGLYSLGEIHLLSLLLRYTARLLLNMQVRLVAFTHLRTVLTGEAGGQLHVNNGSFVSVMGSNASCGAEFDLKVRNKQNMRRSGCALIAQLSLSGHCQRFRPLGVMWTNR